MVAERTSVPRRPALRIDDGLHPLWHALDIPLNAPALSLFTQVSTQENVVLDSLGNTDSHGTAREPSCRRPGPGWPHGQGYYPARVQNISKFFQKVRKFWHPPPKKPTIKLSVILNGGEHRPEVHCPADRHRYQAARPESCEKTNL